VDQLRVHAPGSDGRKPVKELRVTELAAAPPLASGIWKFRTEKSFPVVYPRIYSEGVKFSGRLLQSRRTMKVSRLRSQALIVLLERLGLGHLSRLESQLAGRKWLCM